MQMLFKIQLLDISPAIWRKFVVPSDFSLHKFHQVIQAVMGWYDYHLYAFTIGKTRYQMPDPDDPGAAFGSRYQIVNSKKVSLEMLELLPKQQITYEYDFGDGWTHSIVFEKVINEASASDIPICLDGRRNCPPEDCGSYPGYEELCEAMKNPESKRAKELIDWVGGVYEPEYFNLEEINFDLNSRFKRRKSKKKN